MLFRKAPDPVATLIITNAVAIVVIMILLILISAAYIKPTNNMHQWPPAQWDHGFSINDFHESR
jgi:hypothetical protein